MRQRSDTWMKLAARGTARMESVAVIGGVEYAAISAPVINRGLLSADTLSVGNCISSTLKFSVLTSDTIPKSASVVIKGRLVEGETYSEWLEFGTFYIDRRTTNTGLITLECYDAMLMANQQYVDESNADDRIGWPKSMQACVTEIAYRLGVEIDSRTTIKTTDPYVVPYPTKYTMAQVLGYIGAVHGGNWIITPENKLRLVPLVSPPVETFNIVDYAYNRIYTDDGYKLVWKHTATDEVVEQRAGGGIVNVPVVTGKITTGRSFTISRVTITRDSELGYTAGDSTGFELQINENPYACQAICDDLLDELAGIDYAPYAITGAYYDPASELGDWIIIGEQVRSVLYMETVTLGLSFRVSASAPGKDELDSEYPYLTEIKKLKQEDERLQEYMDEAKDEISSRIEQTYTDILLEVSGTYATKDSVSSSIQIVADAINQEVTRATAAEEQLSGKITINSDKITAEVTRATKAEDELSSSLEIAVGKIDLKVSVGDVSSQISVESGAVTIGSNRLTINSDNFTLSGSGEVTARGTLSSETGLMKTTMQGGSVYFYQDSQPVGIIFGNVSTDTNVWGAAGKAMCISGLQQGLFFCGEPNYNSIYPFDNDLGYIYNLGINPRGYTATHCFFGGELGCLYGFRGTDYYIGWASNDQYAPEGMHRTSTNTGVGVAINDVLIVEGDFSCTGEKNRIVDTPTYGSIKLNAIESTAAVFADMGSGRTDKDGTAYVFFDERFFETIDWHHDYLVFVTATNANKVYNAVKYQNYFVVYGEPDASFDWVVYARQAGYSTSYLDSFIQEKREDIIIDDGLFKADNTGSNIAEAYMNEFTDTLDEQAAAYLRDYETEVDGYDY